MAFPCVPLCTRHLTRGLQICGYSTLSKASRPQEKNSSGPVFQYVGQHRKPNHKVFVWGFSFTGALGIPSFVVPDSGRKKPRKYQLTPYRLETAEKVKRSSTSIVSTIYHKTLLKRFVRLNLSSVVDLFCCLWLRFHSHRLLHQRCVQAVGHGPEQGFSAGLPTHPAQPA